MPDDDRAPVLAFPQAPDAIELRHLRAFVAVAEELNFGRAADRLHLSQSALSRQVRGLEQLLGCDLLRRSTHSVELTIAGEALLDRARRLLTDVDEAVSVTLSIGGRARRAADAAVGAPVRGRERERRAAGAAQRLRAVPRPVRTAAGGGDHPGQRRWRAVVRADHGPRCAPDAPLPPRGRARDGIGVRPQAADGRAGGRRRRAHPGPRVPPRSRASLPRGSRGRAPRVSVDARGRDPGRAGGPGRRLGGLWPGDVAPAEPQAAEPAAPGRGAAVLPLGRPQQHGALVAGRHRRAGRDAARAGPRLRRRVPRRAPARRSRHQPPDRGPQRPAAAADPGRHGRSAARGCAPPRRACPRPRGRGDDSSSTRSTPTGSRRSGRSCPRRWKGSRRPGGSCARSLHAQEAAQRQA